MHVAHDSMRSVMISKIKNVLNLMDAPSPRYTASRGNYSNYFSSGYAVAIER